MSLEDEPPPARQRFLNAPASVLWLIAVFVAVYAVQILSPPAVANRLLQAYALDPAVYSMRIVVPTLGTVTPSLADRVVPLFSHIFLSVDLVQLGFTCVWLLAFGSAVARRFGAAAFLGFFLLCGLGAAAIFIALCWGQNIGMVGASGALSGLVAAASRFMRIGAAPEDDAPEPPFAPLHSPQVFAFGAVWLVASLTLGDIGAGLSGASQAFVWQPLVGGYLAGLLLSGPFEHYFGYAARLRRAGA
ncbi:MAG TPA: rhomboid family intramembrane serine protease [Rhizomicrobium sp.]|jgi:membrane associated rhomboid family serine protease|nr:rhomboid family intramembrane serine protease [Rhizomicrobium sp.]